VLIPSATRSSSSRDGEYRKPFIKRPTFRADPIFQTKVQFAEVVSYILPTRDCDWCRWIECGHRAADTGQQQRHLTNYWSATDRKSFSSSVFVGSCVNLLINAVPSKSIGKENQADSQADRDISAA
jgi:hypothetical protein